MHLHSHFFPCTWGGSLFTGGGWRQRSRAVGLNLIRVSGPGWKLLFPRGCEDGDMVPEARSPEPPKPFLL